MEAVLCFTVLVVGTSRASNISNRTERYSIGVGDERIARIFRLRLFSVGTTSLRRSVVERGRLLAVSSSVTSNADFIVVMIIAREPDRKKTF